MGSQPPRGRWALRLHSKLEHGPLYLFSCQLIEWCSFAVETCESVCVAAGSLFHRILEQRDVSAVNTSGDSVSSELFDTKTTQQHDDRLRYFSFILSVLQLTACYASYDCCFLKILISCYECCSLCLECSAWKKTAVYYLKCSLI